MRKVGKIDWFGGYNRNTDCMNNYGYIKWDDNDDLFIHKSNILCEEGDLKSGVWVTFEVKMFRGKNSAIKVQLLKDEENMSLISECVNSNNLDICTTVLLKYLKSIDLDKGTDFILKRFKSCKQYELLKMSRILEELPYEYFYSSSEIRKYLNRDKHLELLLALWQKERSQEIKSEILELVDDKFKYEIDIYRKLFDEFYKTDVQAKKNIPDNIRIEVLLDLIDSSKGEEEEKVLVEELKQILVEKKADDIIWDKVPNNILIKADLCNHVSLNRQIDIIIEKYKEDINNLENLNIMEQKLLQLPYDEREKRLELLSDDIKIQKNIFYLLSPIKQVDIAWKISNIDWNMLCNKAKVLFIYRMAKENVNISILDGIQERNHVVQSMLSMLWAKYHANESQRKEVFVQLHTRIQNAVLYLSKIPNDKIDLWPILPKCQVLSRIEYCEGRPWPTEEDKLYRRENASRIYCPRKKNKCNRVACINGHIYGDARVYPDRNLSWDNWSLLELMEECNIKPNLNELRNNKEYVCRLGGWVNRLNEIRKRLKCKKCDKSMINNFGYAKNLAVYNSTVVSCNELEEGHDKNVYLSHCWNCHEVIDSREGSVREEGFYLCIHCGNGPQESETYYPGKRCPKCGSYNMNNVYNGFIRGIHTCLKCGHSITVR